jgi:predicted DNA binding CopG/RHH family protein
MQKGGDAMKSVSIRMPEELLSWLREKAAKETIRHDKYVSINSLAVDILTRAMRADKKKGG